DVRLPGRFEVVSHSPTIIVDSAHNVAGIEAFIETATLRTKVNNSRLIFASFRDKKTEMMIERLTEASFNIMLTTFDHERAAQRDDFTDVIQNQENIVYEEN